MREKFNSVLWIDCICGHTGIFDGFIAKVGTERCVGCYMCKRQKPLRIPRYVVENEEISWGFIHNEPLKVKLKVFSEIK